MLKCKKNKLWIENVSNLFCSYTLIPMTGMSLAEQMNSLSRLVIFIFMILLATNFQCSVLFLLLSLLFIIILYYIQKNSMERFSAENYTPIDNRQMNKLSQTRENYTTIDNRQMNNLSQTRVNYLSNSQDDSKLVLPLDKLSVSRKIYDDGSVNLDSVSGESNGIYNNPNWISPNQMMVGPANPKTNIPPVIVPPAADPSFWRGTNLTTSLKINQQGNTDLYRSGYIISDQITEKYRQKDRNKYDGENVNIKHDDDKYTGPFNISQQNIVDYVENSRGHNKDQLIYTGIPSNISHQDNVDDVETSWGYNQDQLIYAGLPSNLSTSGLSRNPRMKQYNENLFTQTIQPGVYTRSEIVEPINSNMGISFTQQLPPVSSRIDPVTGALLKTEHDPRTVKPYLINNNSEYTVNEGDVYDPRFTGYGTSYRSYNDDELGQTRFYYDDVNAVRMPNYISRSHIDTQPFADSYGTIPKGFEKGNPYTGKIHELAENAFLQGAIQHRTDLSERLMRKVNSEQWQRRQAPIRKSGGRMLGGFGK